ncbi:hypothetical protein JX265_001437 [Neoarthrinium moseri]|uniref:Ecp2 effector protein-like domain-containing protein n=1 Tax=Neoarthrinium moseri TaxID=1658444 RepID=A0A9P9WV63_9PEZI|nr:uncharacterized protein JN550_009860 [Neoarthrinium moseri]KAI1863124.1 hypothetical protein JN550_009860 [Neoarthrinium moseri]KAI1879816.1 hypothetical protein JX265_001437 [Neoarthrinium moseri]
MKQLLKLWVMLIGPLQGLGLAMPTAKPTNATESPYDGHSLDRRFSSPFVPTDSWQIICSGIDGKNMSDPGILPARSADCQVLADLWATRGGYWDLTDWDTSAQSIASAGTCSFRVSRPDGANSRVWIGNQDFRRAVGQAIAGFTHGGLVGVLGTMICGQPDGHDVQIAWSIMST